MAFIPIPNSASLCFDFTTAGQDWQFCLTVRKSSGSITPTDLATITATGDAWWLATLDALIDASTTLRQVRATDEQSQGAPQDINPVGTAGTAAGDGLPNNAVMCVSARTAKRGRSYRGRKYLTGLLLQDTTDQVTWGSGAITAYPAAFATLQASLDTAGFDCVVASKQHNGVVTNPAETNEIIAWVTDDSIDSQRRRLKGRGT